MVKEKSCDHGENSLVSTELECLARILTHINQGYYTIILKAWFFTF